MSGETKDFTFSKEKYRHQTRRNIVLLLAVTVVTLVLTVLSLAVNQYGMSLSHIFEVLVNYDYGVQYIEPQVNLDVMLVYEYYVPRAIACVCVGAILAVAGAVMQSVICNPLADSYTTGISGGAYLGVALFVVLGFSITGSHTQLGMIVNAFVFSLIPCFVIILLSMFKKSSPVVIVLVGVAISMFFSAFVSMLIYTSSPTEAEELFKWNLGTLNMVDPSSSPYLITSTVLILVLTILMANKINIISGGDDYCKTVGIDASKFRVVALLVVSIFTSIAVCFVGTLGFVGLVTPHIARMFVGSNNKLLIPVSAIMGSLTLLISDCVARMLITGGVPVGLVTSMIGGPVLMYLIIKMKTAAWN